MLYSLAVAVSLILSVSIADPFLSMFGPSESGDPSWVSCQERDIIDGSLTVVPTVDNMNDFITPCIYSYSLTNGDQFMLRYFQGTDELDLATDLEYTGTKSTSTITQAGRIGVDDLWSQIIPSSEGAFQEEITVRLYSVINGVESELDSFPMIVVRAEQVAGQSGVGFVVRTSKPTTKSQCKSHSDDVSSVVSAASDPIYVCVLFYNPICPNDDSTTTFGISVNGVSGGLTTQLVDDRVDGPGSDAQIFTCNDDENPSLIFRYVKIEGYQPLESIAVDSYMDSYGEVFENSGSLDFSTL